MPLPTMPHLYTLYCIQCGWSYVWRLRLSARHWCGSRHCRPSHRSPPRHPPRHPPSRCSHRTRPSAGFYQAPAPRTLPFLAYTLAKADRRPREKKKFYHQFSIVKYLYLPKDTFRKYVEMHVTRSKLTLKFTGYCRQTIVIQTVQLYTH